MTDRLHQPWAQRPRHAAVHVPARTWAYFALLAWLLAFARGAHAAETPSLEAHAGERLLWLTLGKPPTQEGRPWGEVRQQTLGEPAWRTAVSLARAVVDVAHQDERLVTVFADGTWAWVWPDSIKAGPPLPEARRAVAVAQDGERLWFLADAAAGSATAPSTQAIDPRPTLIAFDGDRYETPHPLPDLPALAVADWTIKATTRGSIVLLARAGGGTLDAWRWDAEQGLRPIESPARPPLLAARLVADTSSLAVVVARPGGVLERVRWKVDRWGDPETLAAHERFADASLAVASLHGDLRLFAFDDDGLWEQSLRADGTSLRDPRRLDSLAVAPSAGNVLVRSIVTLSLIPVLIWSMLQGPTGMPSSTLRPAPILSRLAAGVVDAAPIIAGMTFLAAYRQSLGIASDQPPREQDETIFGLSILAYLVYNLGSELLFGRSPGKMIFGLVVVRPDGTRPDRARVIARNLSRAIDVLIVPLALVWLTPLRQRMGDVVAGTMVVAASELPPGDGAKSSKSSPPGGESPPAERG